MWYVWNVLTSTAKRSPNLGQRWAMTLASGYRSISRPYFKLLCWFHFSVSKRVPDGWWWWWRGVGVGGGGGGGGGVGGGGGGWGGGGGGGGWGVGVGGQLRFVTRSSIIIQCCCDSVSSGYQMATNIHIYHNSAYAKFYIYIYIERKHSFGISRKSSIRFQERLICDHVLKTQACQVRLNIYRLDIPSIVQTVLSCFVVVRYRRILAIFFRIFPLALSGEYTKFTINTERDHDTA